MDIRICQDTNPYKNQPGFYASISFRGSFDYRQSLQGGPKKPVISKVKLTTLFFWGGAIYFIWPFEIEEA